MKLTKDHLYNLLIGLPTTLECDYVIAKENKKVKRKDVEGKDIYFAIYENGEESKIVPLTESSMEYMASAIKENEPISIDTAMANKGNGRSAIEGAIVMTPEFYSIKIGSNKNIVWVPSKCHEAGKKGVWPEGVELPEPNNREDSVVGVKEVEVRDDYSLVELGAKLASMMKEGKDTFGYTVVCQSFGFKYGKAIETNDYKPHALIEEANNLGAAINHTHDAAVKEGSTLYKVFSKQYFGLRFTKKSAPNFSTIANDKTDDIQKQAINALHTKPFLLLAGISGTGKSQKVLELAYMSCPKDFVSEESNMPLNYCLIEVKPNWHDSSDLLGYYSALTGKYELTDFIRFVYRATKNPDIPFFLCLDEMNLAPVEQYFAEYLSVLETRKLDEGEIISQPLLRKEKFCNCKLGNKIEVVSDGNVTETVNGVIKQYKVEPLYEGEDYEIIEYLKEEGLPLPSNLFVIGTVNMDDTTHQFSRKVIDRAFTIEMNGGKMADMFSDRSRMLLEYRENPVPLSVFQSEFVRAYQVLDNARFNKYAEIIKERIPKILGEPEGETDKNTINGILQETPFRVSYRVQNELVLYLSVLIEQANYPDEIDSLITEATLAILMEKILPRVQGEKKQLETANNSDVLKDLKVFIEEMSSKTGEESSIMLNKVVKKLDEMEKKLDSYYTNFF